MEGAQSWWAHNVLNPFSPLLVLWTAQPQKGIYRDQNHVVSCHLWLHIYYRRGSGPEVVPIFWGAYITSWMQDILWYLNEEDVRFIPMGQEVLVCAGANHFLPSGGVVQCQCPLIQLTRAHPIQIIEWHDQSEVPGWREPEPIKCWGLNWAVQAGGPGAHLGV